MTYSMIRMGQEVLFRKPSRARTFGFDILGSLAAFISGMCSIWSFDSDLMNDTLTLLSIIVGWIYFVAWSISFYPQVRLFTSCFTHSQVILNWRRKSVVGYSFDYLAYNVTGFVAYSLFNASMFFSPLVQRQYISVYGVCVIHSMDDSSIGYDTGSIEWCNICLPRAGYRSCSSSSDLYLRRMYATLDPN